MLIHLFLFQELFKFNYLSIPYIKNQFINRLLTMGMISTKFCQPTIASPKKLDVQTLPEAP